MKAAGLIASAALLSMAMTGTAGAASPSSLNVDNRNNGQTITVHQGQRLHVVLYSTYWTINGGHNQAVRVVSAQQFFPDNRSAGCHAGSGCGYVSRDFLATSPGSATLTAARTTCGEALRCAPSQSSWTLTVRVQR